MIPFSLACEYATDPLGVDVRRPRFGWLLESEKRGDAQTACQILVASSPEKLAADVGDKWDSGKVESDNSVNVPYEGDGLASGERCFWKVRVWDADGEASRWSETAKFEMGLLDEADWHGKWIGAHPSVSAPLLRKEFELPAKARRARAYISGLGWYELYVNGRRVGDHVLDPATSDYGERVYYVTYDVTDYLKAGVNAVGVMLGNGWFSEPGWQKNVRVRGEWYGTKDWERGYAGESPQLLMQLNVELDDGRAISVVTDGTWKTSAGPITWNDFYNGETYDARLEKTGWHLAGYDDSGWPSAEVKDAPGGRMVSQMLPPIKVIARIRPVKVTEPEKGIYVYDLGRLFGGWASVRLKGPAGQKVAIRYSARLDAESGLLDRNRYGDDKASDYYILKGDPNGETYEPRFTYHPVRYVQIENSPCELSAEDVEGCVVHSDVDLSGDFECSSELLNRIHRNVVRTFTNGLYGIPLDCLYREHWAWTDPATITGTLYPRKYMPIFWTKWLDDIKDAQRADGAVPNICPNYRGDASDPAWGGNYPLLVWYLHQYYDDTRILEEHYDGMTKCVDYLASIAEGLLVKEGFFGDHMLPGDEPGKEEFISSETPPPLVWTGYFYRGAFVVAEAARALGRQDDAERYAALADKIRNAFNAEWFDDAAGHYAAGSQTANLLPLALGIVPAGREHRALENVIRSITEKYECHHHTGNTGTTCMIDTLTRAGQGELMYKVVTQRTYPGWGYMVAQGATTIWESWSLVAGCGNAESMIMWATIDEFFYNDLAGIRGPEYYGPAYAPGGFREIEIEPHVLGDLEFARASIRTVRGTVSSSWRRTDDGMTLEVTVPVGTRAKVSVPKTGLEDVTVSEAGRVVWKNAALVAAADGISAGRETDDCVSFEVGGGSYSFTLAGRARG